MLFIYYSRLYPFLKEKPLLIFTCLYTKIKVVYQYIFPEDLKGKHG